MQDKSSWPEWMTEFYDTGEKLYHIIADNKPQDQEIIASPAHLGEYYDGKVQHFRENSAPLFA